MSKPSEIEAKRQEQVKNSADKILETFKSPGWKDEIQPVLEKIFVDNQEDSLSEGEPGREARAKMKAIISIYSAIGVKINHGEKARAFLNNKLRGE